MIVYHGSKVIVDKPDILHSRKKVDFGAGFYITPIYEQAKGLCKRFMTLGQEAFISKYTLDDAVFNDSKINMLKFDTYSEEWLDYIFKCRKEDDDSEYDLVMGGVANDKVFDTVELYFQNMISKSEALGRLKYEKPNYQICIRSQSIIDTYLHFEGSDRL